MTPYPQRKDARASSFVVCFEGKIQPAHKTGSSAPHRPAGLSLSLSHTPRPRVTISRLGAPLQERPRPGAGSHPWCWLSAQSGPRGPPRPKPRPPWQDPEGSWTRLAGPETWSLGAQLSWLSSQARGTGSGPPPLGVPRAPCSGQNCGLLEGNWAAPSEPRPVRSSGLWWMGGCRQVGPPSLRPRASGGSR